MTQIIVAYPPGRMGERRVYRGHCGDWNAAGGWHNLRAGKGPRKGESRMQRKKAIDFDPEVLRWFDRYVHGLVDRRGFLNGVARYAVGGVSAAMLLEALSPRFAQARQVA